MINIKATIIVRIKVSDIEIWLAEIWHLLLSGDIFFRIDENKYN